MRILIPSPFETGVILLSLGMSFSNLLICCNKQTGMILWDTLRFSKWVCMLMFQGMQTDHCCVLKKKNISYLETSFLEHLLEKMSKEVWYFLDLNVFCVFCAVN